MPNYTLTDIRCDTESVYYDPRVCDTLTQAEAGTPWGRYFLIGAFLLGLLILIGLSVRIVNQYERGVVYRLGRVTGARSPGLNFIIPFIDQMKKILVAIVAEPLESQQVITNDNVSITVSAVVYYRVKAAVTAEVEVEDYKAAINQRGQSVLRQVIGASPLKQVLANSSEVVNSIKSQLAEIAESWGLDVQSIELKDVELPESMKRALAAEAEAERQARAKIIAAEGEKKSAALLAEAGGALGQIGLRLRELQTILEIGTENNTVIVVDSHEGVAPAMSAAGQIAGQRSSE